MELKIVMMILLIAAIQVLAIVGSRTTNRSTDPAA